MSTSRPHRKSTREAILDAAVQLFGERGQGISLEEIAQQAGVSRQSVYVHFGSRTGLLMAVVQHVDASGPLDELLQRVFDAPGPVEAVEAVVSLHAEYSPLAYPIARVFMTSRHEDDALRVAWDDRMEGRRNLYRFVIDWLNREGLLAPEWPLPFAVEMLAALTSWQVWEQLVIDRGWSSDDYAHYLQAAVRRTFIGRDGESKPRSGG